jgi:hypothetical protein
LDSSDIRYSRRKLEEFKTKPEAPVPGAPGDDTAFEEATHQALAHQEKDAVDASLEEAALVQTALETQKEDSPQDHITRALARRVDHYKSGKSSPRTTETQHSLRRQQHLLRDIIQKCNPEQIGTVTLNEIHLIVHCYAIIKERSGFRGRPPPLRSMRSPHRTSWGSFQEDRFCLGGGHATRLPVTETRTDVLLRRAASEPIDTTPEENPAYVPNIH